MVDLKDEYLGRVQHRRLDTGVAIFLLFTLDVEAVYEALDELI